MVINLALRPMRASFWYRWIWALMLAGTAIAFSGCATEKPNMMGMDANALLESARKATENGQSAEALKFYDQIEARFPYSVFSRQSLLDQAYNYYQQADDTMALTTIERFLRLYPNQEGSDYAYYLRGLVHYGTRHSIIDFLIEAARSQRDIEASKNAYQAFEVVTKQFPNSRYAADAETRMAILYNQMGQYEVELARFYFNRGAFVASATRSSAALTDYPRAQSQEEALALLAVSYARLDLPRLRDDTLAIININYPNSEFLRKYQ